MKYISFRGVSNIDISSHHNSVNCDRPGERSPEKDCLTSAQVVETSVNVTSNSPSQDYTHPDDHNLPNYGMTPGFKPFTVISFTVSLFCVLAFISGYKSSYDRHELERFSSERKFKS